MSRRRAKPHVSAERWIVSYSDLVTLLFGLFVVMYALARQDQNKQTQVSESVDAAFRSLGLFPSSSVKPGGKGDGSGAGTGSGAGGGGTTATDKAEIPMNIVMGEDVMSPAEVKQDLEHLKKEMTQALSNQVAQHTVSIQMGKDGLIISLREAGFFASGSANPKQDTVEALDKIAAALSRTPYDMRIEGHTDNIPIHSGTFDSNWELSSARATRIARLMLLVHATTPEKLSAAGYAEFHPVATNDTTEGRAQNRRVDIVILPRSHVNFANMAAASKPAAASDGAWQKITDGN